MLEFAVNISVKPEFAADIPVNIPIIIRIIVVKQINFFCIFNPPYNRNIF